MCLPQSMVMISKYMYTWNSQKKIILKRAMFVNCSLTLTRNLLRPECIDHHKEKAVFIYG